MPDTIENVRVIFDAETAGLAEAVNVYESIEKADADLANQAKKSADAMNKQSKDMSTLLTGNKKSIDDLSKSFSNLDKSITAGTYKKVLGDIRKELQLTDTQAKAFYQNLINNSKQNIVGANNEQELQELNALIAAATEELNLMGGAEEQVEKKSVSMKAQLRALKEELANLDDPSDPRFLKLSAEAAELEDKIGDVSAQVRLLSSDTAGIDAAIQTVRGFAAAYSLAQVAVAAFGGENEELQKALQQVFYVMQALQSVQEVMALVDKNSALNIFLLKTLRGQQATATATAATAETGLTTATNANTAATGAATVAQRALNTAMSLNPAAVLILSIVALAGAYVAFVDNADEAKEAQERFNRSFEQGIKLNQQFTDAIRQGGNKYIAELKARGATDKQIRDAELFNLQQELEQTQKFLNSKTAAYEAADEQLRLIAANGGYTVEYVKGFKTFKKVSDDTIAELQKSKSTYEDLRKDLNVLQTNYDIKLLENQAATNKEISDKQKEADEKAKADREKAIQKALDDHKKYVDSIKTLYQNLSTIEQNRTIFSAEQFKRDADNENNLFGFRIASLKLYQQEQEKAIKQAADDEIKINGLTGAAAQIVREKAGQDTIKLNQSVEEQLAGIRKSNKEKSDADNLKSEEDFQNKIIALGDESLKKQQANKEKADAEDLKREAKKQQEIQLLQTVAQGLSDLFFSGQQKQYDLELQKLDELKDKKIITEEAYAKKANEIRRAQAQNDKIAAVFQTLISQAPVLLKGFETGGFVGVAAAAGLFFSLLSTVTSQNVPQFRKGGFTGNKNKDEVAGVVHGQEFVAHAEATKRYEPALKAMNDLKFEDYLASLQVPTFQGYSMPAAPEWTNNYSQGASIDYDKLGEAIAKHQGRMSDIPGFDIRIDESGVTAMVRRENEVTEFRNKRYSSK